MVSTVRTVLVILFIIVATSSFAATIEYQFNDSSIIFTILFDKGYSNVNSYDDNGTKVVSFDTTESFAFERQDFFDIPIASIWISNNGTRKQVFFEFEKNKILEPIISKSPKSINIEFIIPEALYTQPSGVPNSKTYLRMVFGLVLIIGIIIGSTIIMKRFLKSNTISDIPGVGRLLGKVNLDLKKHLIFYELGDIIYIIASNENSITMLDKITDPVEITTIKTGFAKRKDFSSYMKIFSKNKIADDINNSKEVIEEKLSYIKKR